MSNTETINNDQWADRTLTENQQKNRQSAELIPFGERGVTPENFAQAVDFAKVMSTARGAVPAHLVNNTGACLAVIELGQKFQMSAYMLAMGCFSVNGMLAFTGQTIMAIMNKHMPLAKTERGERTRLKYEFKGEKGVWEMREIPVLDRDDRPTGNKIWKAFLIRPSTRQVIVSGRFENEADVLTYESPQVQFINNKNSPLWVEDEDQQLIYWASKRWQRRHWPEGMLGIYDNEEVRDRHIGADNAKLIEASDNPGQALVERIAAAKAQTESADKVTEGFTKDHAHTQTDPNQRKSADDFVFEKQTGEVVEASAAENVVAAASDGGPEPVVTDQNAEATPPGTNDEPEHEIMPQTAAEWRGYALSWINKLGLDPNATAADMNARWKSETRLRNDCGITSDMRDEVYDVLLKLREDKPAAEKAPAKKKTK